MKTRCAIFCVVFLWLANSVFAHRLDEYLQATTVAVESNRVTLQMCLTPGVSVASKVIAEIGAGDTAQRAYAEKVRQDLSMAVDGTPLELRLVSWSFPEVGTMTNGLSEILLKFEADLPPAGLTRRLTLRNHHQSAIASYLVNCLVPDDPNIHVLAQERNYNQSFYQLDFAVSNVSEGFPAASSRSGFRRWLEHTGNLSVLESYFFHGIHHILTGYDHLLFVSALVLGAATLWDLVKVVTAFTLAHTITLTLAALNLVHLPSGVIEPLISASIVFVAVQNVFWPSQAKGWSRLGAAFFFGLFHGLGFAGGLLDAMREMPGSTMILALAGFSIGVEVGHQIVVLPLFAFLKTARSLRTTDASRTSFTMAFQRCGSALISVAGVYYLCLALIN